MVGMRMPCLSAKRVQGASVDTATVWRRHGTFLPGCPMSGSKLRWEETTMMGVGRARELADVLDFISTPPGYIPEPLRRSLGELVRALERGDHVGGAERRYEPVPWLREGGGETEAGMPEPVICPGCHSVDEQPCMSWCPDAAIARDDADDREFVRGLDGIFDDEDES